MLIPMKELNARKPDAAGGGTDIYYLNGAILAKRFKNCYGAFKKAKLQRYEYSKGIKGLTGMSLPVDILETERGFCGCVEAILPGTFSGDLVDFSDYMNKCPSEITLDKITDYIIKCADIVEVCHRNGIINPDMLSLGNILFNMDDSNVYFVDYQDMQTGDIPSTALSSFIASDSIIRSDKYYNGSMYTPNIDLYSLAVRYYSFATKINVPRAINGHGIDELLFMSGFDDTPFAQCMRTLYNPDQDNLDIREVISDINRDYELTLARKGQVRKLVRK